MSVSFTRTPPVLPGAWSPWTNPSAPIAHHRCQVSSVARREVLCRVRISAPTTATSSQALGVSDPAISRALRPLEESGLVRVTRDPQHARRRLVELTATGRETYHFDGLVVSDYDSVNLPHTAHRTARTEDEAAVQALPAGLDVELPGSPNHSHLVDEVTSGRLDEQVVDVAVTRMLATSAGSARELAE
ncbi:glycoside hydrolase family 3 N-terminal domain-containing protein [Streptomyces sp. Agncl-13]|uniref:MarR family winged helix-turn-helix transcriptional regulator n=1 Tax=Streptomyces sp. Agncl-13 TaxID=3400628 RepID=UPI003A83F466